MVTAPTHCSGSVCCDQACAGPAPVLVDRPGQMPADDPAWAASPADRHSVSRLATAITTNRCRPWGLQVRGDCVYINAPGSILRHFSRHGYRRSGLRRTGSCVGSTVRCGADGECATVATTAVQRGRRQQLAVPGQLQPTNGGNRCDEKADCPRRLVFVTCRLLCASATCFVAADCVRAFPIQASSYATPMSWGNAVPYRQISEPRRRFCVHA